MKLFKLISVVIASIIILCGQHAYASGQSERDLIKGLTLEQILPIAHAVLDTPLTGSESVENEANSYAKAVLMWTVDTKEVSITMNPIPEIATQPNVMMAYLSAELIHMAERGLKKNNRDTFIASMKDVLKYYETNRKAIGEIPELNALAALSPELLDKKLESIYNKATKVTE